MTQTFKLTKDMRATIASRVLAGRFDEQDKKLHDRFQKLAEDVYNRQYRGKHLALIESLPVDWLQNDDDIKVSLGGAGCPAAVQRQLPARQQLQSCSRADVQALPELRPLPVSAGAGGGRPAHQALRRADLGPAGVPVAAQGALARGRGRPRLLQHLGAASGGVAGGRAVHEGHRAHGQGAWHGARADRRGPQQAARHQAAEEGGLAA